MKKRRLLSFVLALLMLPALAVTAGAEEAAMNSADPDAVEEVLLSTATTPDFSAIKDYIGYLEETASVPEAAQDVTITPDQLAAGDGRFTRLDSGVQIGEDGEMTVLVTVPETAMYELRLDSMPEPGRSAPCELVVLINGEIPYRQAATIMIDRIWRDAKDTIETDSNGNDIRPAQVESPEFAERRLMDSSGYNIRPLLFKLTQGENRITIRDNRESILIREMTLCAPEKILEHDEYLKEHPGATPAAEGALRVQAEKAAWKSDPVLVPTMDRSSPLTEPYKGSKISLNTIGQENWDLPGQTIAWSVDVPADGLYEIRFKARQNYIRGTYSCRTLLVDGKIPFAEAESIKFTFSNTWQMVTLGDGRKPAPVYLTKGRHELSLRVTLGDLGEILGRVSSCASEVSGIYRQFLMIMGSTPDTMRDYKLERQLPEVFVQMSDIADRLETIVKEMSAVTGVRGTELLSLTRMAITLREFVSKPYNIASKFSEFTNNMSALNAWKNDATYRPLEIDYIEVVPPGAPAARVVPNIWQSIAHGVTLFAASFTESYDSLGQTADTAKTVTVWTTSGRDQAQVLYQRVKSYFSQQNNINVNIELVKGEAILPSIVAGNGPDIVLSASQQTPVDYALRGAVIDLAVFEAFSEVAADFRESALLPVTFNGGVYGLPETETFPMLFYRKDILDEIGVPVPDTWDEVLKIIPDLQKHNMSFLLETGIAASTTGMFGQGTDNTLGLSTFAMLLYQNGGRIYEGDGIRTLLDGETAIETFKQWCKFYTNYGLPANFNAAYRFRTGESPLVVSDLSLYNVLMISAPEIKGLWDMTTVPGTARGSAIDKSVRSRALYTIMTKTCRDREAAWAFIKWWLSEDTQLSYARDLESLIGTAARYMTANTAAFARLPWSSRDMKSILEQSRWTFGIPEVPGGYFLPRHINNAFRSVVINKADPRESLASYAMVINAELKEKRREFGLPAE